MSSSHKDILKHFQAVMDYLNTQFMGQIPTSILKKLHLLKSYLESLK